MAVAVQEMSLSAGNISTSPSPDWRIQGSLCSKNEKMSGESLSICSTSTSRTLLSRCESRSPGGNYDFFTPASQQESSKKDLESTDASDVESGLLHEDEKPVMRKSRAGLYVLERPRPTHRSPHERPHRGQSREDKECSGMERYSKATPPDEKELSFLEKCNLGGDGPNISGGSLNLFSTDQTEKQTLNQNNQLQPSTFKVDDSEPQSKSFDIELMYQKYNLDYSGNKKPSDQSELKPLNKRLPSYTIAPTHGTFELSDLAMKLRGSVCSEFLANELRPRKKPTPLDPTKDPHRALRTIDDILKEHGIPNKFPQSTSVDEPSWRGNLPSRTESINVSQNNETLPSSSETPDRDIRASPNIRDVPSLPESTTSLLVKDTKTNSLSYLGHTSLPTSKTGFRSNLSHNKETIMNVITGEDESLRRFGSSVDYSITGGPGKYSLAAKPSYGMSGYGKTATPFSGDVTVAPVTTIIKPDFKPHEEINMNTIIPPPPGSQVDLAKLSPDPTQEKETSFELIRGMGSATDALEFSMSGERERLRKLDTMITSTPLYSSNVTTPHRPLTNRFETPERDYTKFANDLLDRRVYSTITFPSSFGTGLTTKSSWSGSLNQRSRTNILEKSSSAPGFWSRSFQPTSRYSSSIQTRSPFWPYLSKRDYDVQYNNSTYTPQQNLQQQQQQQAEKSDSTKTPAKNQKKTAVSKKKTYGSGSTVNNSNQSQSFQVPSFLGGFLGNMHDPSKQRGNVAKSAQMKSSAGTKKPGNASNSKNTSDSYFDFCFAKDLDRMWQETMSGKPQAPNPVAKSPKFSQHKPYQPLQAKKEDKSNMVSGSTDHTRETRQVFTRICQSYRKPEVLAGTGGKYGGYESNFQSRQNNFVSEYPVKSNRNNQENSKRSANSQSKLKSTVVAANQRAAMPKSILKQDANKSTNWAFGSATKPQPTETSTTKSDTMMQNQQPYMVHHIYSPMSLYSLNQSYVPDFAKTAESPMQNRMAFDNLITSKPCFNF